MSLRKNRRPRSESPALAALAKLAFLEGRIKGVCAALGCGPKTAELIVAKGIVPERLEAKVFDEIRNRLEFNHRLLIHARGLLEQIEEDRRNAAKAAMGEMPAGLGGDAAAGRLRAGGGLERRPARRVGLARRALGAPA